MVCNPFTIPLCPLPCQYLSQNVVLKIEQNTPVNIISLLDIWYLQPQTTGFWLLNHIIISLHNLTHYWHMLLIDFHFKTNYRISKLKETLQSHLIQSLHYECPVQQKAALTSRKNPRLGMREHFSFNSRGGMTSLMTMGSFPLPQKLGKEYWYWGPHQGIVRKVLSTRIRTHIC